TTYPSYALNLAQLGALCISNLCATKPLMIQTLEEEKVWKKEQILDHEKKMLDLFELDYQDFVK
ncbi:hypothetical protein KTI54_16830, partial [Acinetobacter pittii]|uniref:hypothetical protein n=1 Tax=Acinetobacter pittii TaxID=48296 RepID=UPI0021CDC023